MLGEAKNLSPFGRGASRGRGRAAKSVAAAIPLTLWLTGWVRADEIEKNLNRARDFNAIQTVYRGGVPHTDKNGRLLMQYDPQRSFFQIGSWGAPLAGKGADYDYDWNLLKEAGYNTVWPWMADAAKSVAAGEKYGLQIVVMGEIPAPETAGLKSSPSLLANVWADEPIGKCGTPEIDRQYADFAAYKARMKEAAPGLPVFVNDAPWIMAPATSWWVKWDLAGDISCDDNYPVMDRTGRALSIGADPNGIPQVASLQVATGQQKKPVWLIIGAFTQPGPYGQSFPFRFATPEQLRACAYAGIIHGASGIICFIWDSYISRDGGCIGISPKPQVVFEPKRQIPATPAQLIQSKALWDTAAQINRELAELTPAILSPTVGPELNYTAHIEGKAPTPTPIRALLKPSLEGGYLLLTVNVDDAVLKTTYAFPKPIADAQVLFENRPPEKLAPGSKEITLTYEPFDTHVIRIKLAP